MRQAMKRALALIMSLMMTLNVPCSALALEYPSSPVTLPPFVARPTAEPTLTLGDITADKALYQIGETITWRITSSGAESIFYQIAAPDGQSVATGTLTPVDGAQTAVGFTAQQSGTYVLMVAAARGEQSLPGRAEANVAGEALMASIAMNQRYAIAEHEAAGVTLTIAGGVAPYSIAMSVLRKDEIKHSETLTSEDGHVSYSYMPMVWGEHEFVAVITDAAGATTKVEARTPVSARMTETEEEWEASVRGAKLTGDWRDDLIEVALTQLGYEQDERHFIMDEDGTTHYYTRYGDWWGADYAEWCAIFISFCLKFANVPGSAIPREAGTVTWKNALGSLYMSDLDAYEPKKGDLVFFNWEGDAEPVHVGIVEKVTNDEIHTIQGNAGGAVKRIATAVGTTRSPATAA